MTRLKNFIYAAIELHGSRVFTTYVDDAIKVRASYSKESLGHYINLTLSNIGVMSGYKLQKVSKKEYRLWYKNLDGPIHGPKVSWESPDGFNTINMA